MSTTESYAREPCCSYPQCCTECRASVPGSRNLIVCIDGTSNQFGDHDTNVMKLFTNIDLTMTHPEQLAYYSSGIGTNPKSSNILNRMGRAISDKLDMAIAWNIEEIIKETYSWLVRTYREGDQIYLFGFSRGAYQIRILASMIYEVGLIRTYAEKHIRRAYDYHKAIHSGNLDARCMAKRFKSTFSWTGMRVHFVGVWDTVSSVGLIRGNEPLLSSLCTAHACQFRHALALDERRVKFIPEYICKVNCQPSGAVPVDIDISKEYVTSSTSARRRSNGPDLSGEKKDKTSGIKEVWFPGSHSDVGGRNRPGVSHHAGNVSLSWMRREAAACGLVLKPTDTAWVPDDLDFGTRESMTRAWWMVEYMPITHQVSFSGDASGNKRCLHRLQPRRIIPGQKVHASILYSHSYRPWASFGGGIDMLIVHNEPEMEPDNQLWETRLFDDTTARELMAYLVGQQGVSPIYLDRLLFMLRFEEGKQGIRNVPDWHDQFLTLICNRACAPLVRLVTIVAYYEASYDSDAHSKGSALPDIILPKETFDDAKKILSGILKYPKHRDGPRVVALLGPLTQHQVLREHILTPNILNSLVNLLDVMITDTGENFGRAMDGLICLLRCEDTRAIIIEKLGDKLPSSEVSRLSRILDVKDAHLLTAALRMVMTLARISEAKSACSRVKPRLRELAQKDKQLVCLLSVEVLLDLYDPTEREQLNIRNANVRTNLASALDSPNPDRGDSADGEGLDGNARQLALRQLFGVDDAELTDRHRWLIRELKHDVQNGNARERFAATLMMLRLCESETIRKYLREIDLLGAFISQLRRKDKALLAAFALNVCLGYHDMKESIKDNEHLPRNVVGMLRHDYFDDFFGQVEGFLIFDGFMRHEDLREKISDYDISEVLGTKLAKGTARETRTSLICLDIFRSFKENDWTKDLVKKGLGRLQERDSKAHKEGVMILSALARREYGVTAIGPELSEIIKMLLPDGYLPTRSAALETSTTTGPPPSEAQTPPAPAPQVSADAATLDSLDPPSRPPSRMMGPACALRVLAQNEKLRDTMRKTIEYDALRHLYLAGTLVGETDTRPWRGYTPKRSDVIDVLDEMIKFIDEEIGYFE